MKAAKAALQKCPKRPQKAAMKCSRSSPAKAAKAAMKCKAAKAMKVGRPRKCSKVKKAMKVADYSKVKKAMSAECSKVKKAMKAMKDWKAAMKVAKVAMKAECSKLKKAMKVVECLKETKWKAGTIPLDLEKLAKAANEGQELGMWLDLWLDEIRTLGATLLASASKEQVETRGATITDSEEQVETHSEDWWKRDLPEWVFEEAMATAQKNNLDEGIVQPSGVLPGHVTSAVAQGSASSQ